VQGTLAASVNGVGVVTSMTCSFPSHVSTITVAPGSTPAGGYLPLSLFGIGPIAGMGDGSVVNFNVPTFTWAGQTWTRLGVASDGYVIIGGDDGGTSNPVNTSLPNAASPHNIIAPFWTNLNPAAGGGVRIGTLTDGSSTWIVVDWQKVPNAADATTNSFEIWLRIESGAGLGAGEQVSFGYGTGADSIGTGSGGLLTVGAQDINGHVGGVLYFNGTGTLPVPRSQYVVTSGS